MVSTTRQQHVYDTPSGTIPPLGDYLRRVWARRHLIWHLSRTGAKAAHYDTVLGRLWLLLDPIFTAFTFYLIRMVLIPNSKPNASAWIAHLILAVTLFTYFRRVFEGTARCIVSNQLMVLNSSAPSGTYPAVVMTRAVYDLVPAMFVYLCIHLILGQPLGPSLIFFPLVIVMMTVFALGLGLALVPSVVFVRDMGELIPYMSRIWMYLTPIMFFVSEIPSGLRPVLVINPLYPYFDALEQIFMGHMPTMGSLAGGFAWAASAILAGTIIFLRKEREFAIRL